MNMKYIAISRIKVELSETDVKENRIHFDQKTLELLGITDVSTLKIENEKTQWIRADDFGHGARTEKLNFVDENKNHLLYVNRNIELEIVSNKPYTIKLHILN